MKIIKAEEAKRISNLQINEDLFNEYLKKLDFLIRRNAMKNETSIHIEVLNKDYAIALTKVLRNNGYNAAYVANSFGKNKSTYFIYCYWN